MVWLPCWIKWIMLLRINANVGSTDYKKMYYQNPLILKTISLTFSFFPVHGQMNGPCSCLYLKVILTMFMFLVKLLFEAAVMLDPSLFRRAPIFELLAHGKIGFKIESSSSSRNIIVVIIIVKIR